MTKTKKKPQLYLARGPGLGDVYELWNGKPRFDKAFVEWTENKGISKFYHSFCNVRFETATGFKMRPRQCKKVTITIKEVK